VFGFGKTGEMFQAVCYVKEQNGLAGCRQFALMLASTWSSVDVQTKQVGIFAYRIKTQGSGHAFSQRNRLQIEAMVWFVCATSSWAMRWLK